MALKRRGLVKTNSPNSLKSFHIKYPISRSPNCPQSAGFIESSSTHLVSMVSEVYSAMDAVWWTLCMIFNHNVVIFDNLDSLFTCRMVSRASDRISNSSTVCFRRLAPDYYCLWSVRFWSNLWFSFALVPDCHWALYNKTSMTRKPMARLSWLIWSHFESIGNYSNSSRKQTFRDYLGNFLILEWNVYCVYSLESILMSTLSVPLLYKTIPICFLTWRYD